MRVSAWSFVAVALLGLLIPFISHAEQKKTLGQWDVHYIVLDTTFLTPEIAKANQIVRSKYNALVNISVLDKETQEAQNLSVTGSARNLLGNQKNLDFKRVVDGKAIYYLAVLSHDHREKFRFEVNIQQGNTQEVLKFEEELYVN
jgi:hypothetical protein